MTSYILGVDLSTKRIDVAAIPLHDEPQLGRNIHLTYSDIPQPKRGEHVDPAERAIRAMRSAYVCLSTLDARDLDIHAVAVEHPAGRHVHPSLLATYGAVCCAFRMFPVASYKPAEWRRLIGCTGPAVNEKEGGRRQVAALVGEHVAESRMSPLLHLGGILLGGDEADAIGIALAHRTLLARQEAA